MLVKVLASNFCFIEHLLGSESLAMGRRCNSAIIFLINLYLFDSRFSETVWIDNLYNCVETIWLPNNGSHGNGKKHYFSYHSNNCKEKILYQNHESYKFELPLIQLSSLGKY